MRRLSWILLAIAGCHSTASQEKHPAPTAPNTAPAASSASPTEEQESVRQRLALSVPQPDELPTIDRKNLKINTVVVVVGKDAHAFVQHVYAKTSDGGAAIDLTKPGEASFDYFPLRLGDIRGYSVSLHLYAFGPEAKLSERVKQAAGAADAVIVVQNDGADEANILTVAKNLRTTVDVPVAVLGNDQLKRDCTKAFGKKVVLSESDTESSFFPALKAVTKGALVVLRDEKKPDP